jgi:hypothetical protein
LFTFLTFTIVGEKEEVLDIASLAELRKSLHTLFRRFKVGVYQLGSELLPVFAPIPTEKDTERKGH